MAGPLHASPMALPRPAEEGIMRRFALRGGVPAELRLPPMAQRFCDASAALAEALDSKLHPRHMWVQTWLQHEFAPGCERIHTCSQTSRARLGLPVLPRCSSSSCWVASLLAITPCSNDLATAPQQL